jgi:hypothetical protein
MGELPETIVEKFVQACSRERGVNTAALRAMLRDFIVCLHESQFKSGYSTLDGSVINQVYWALGDEAAYHFCELLAYDGRGHDPGEVYTALEYQDSHAKRFHTTIDRWQLECDREIADEEPEEPI